MDPSRADRILDEWNAVADGVRRPSAPPQRVAVRGANTGVTLAGAGMVLIVLIAAVVWLRLPGSTGTGGLVPTASPSATAVVSPTPSITPAPSITPVPTPTAAPTIGPCAPTELAARIVLWEGAAGQRTAQVETTNASSISCTLATVERPQLVDGSGAVLIDGTAPDAAGRLTLAPGDVAKTLVQAGNYCGPAPLPPVSVAFVLSDGGRFVATPPTPTDATVPPCLGSGQPATIGMQPWAR